MGPFLPANSALLLLSITFWASAVRGDGVGG